MIAKISPFLFFYKVPNVVKCSFKKNQQYISLCRTEEDQTKICLPRRGGRCWCVFCIFFFVFVFYILHFVVLCLRFVFVFCVCVCCFFLLLFKKSCTVAISFACSLSEENQGKQIAKNDCSTVLYCSICLQSCVQDID